MTEPAISWLPHDHPYIQLESDAAEVRYEDTSQAAIVEVGTDTDEDEGVFVRVQSWSPSGEHPFIDSLVGRRVQVTIEVMPG